jgi:hypothetical protein
VATDPDDTEELAPEGTGEAVGDLHSVPPTDVVTSDADEPRAISGHEGEVDADGKRKGRLASWFGRGAKKVVTKLYDTHADDIEERARRAVGSAYKDSAEDLQERAIRAMREAIRQESRSIKDAIEHAVEIKKREVRLSLIVLVVASLVYLGLWWVTS